MTACPAGNIWHALAIQARDGRGPHGSTCSAWQIDNIIYVTNASWINSTLLGFPLHRWINTVEPKMNFYSWYQMKLCQSHITAWLTIYKSISSSLWSSLKYLLWFGGRMGGCPWSFVFWVITHPEHDFFFLYRQLTREQKATSVRYICMLLWSVLESKMQLTLWQQQVHMLRQLLSLMGVCTHYINCAFVPLLPYWCA